MLQRKEILGKNIYFSGIIGDDVTALPTFFSWWCRIYLCYCQGLPNEFSKWLNLGIGAKSRWGLEIHHD